MRRSFSSRLFSTKTISNDFTEKHLFQLASRQNNSFKISFNNQLIENQKELKILEKKEKDLSTELNTALAALEKIRFKVEDLLERSTLDSSSQRHALRELANEKEEHATTCGSLENQLIKIQKERNNLFYETQNIRQAIHHLAQVDIVLTPQHEEIIKNMAPMIEALLETGKLQAKFILPHEKHLLLNNANGNTPESTYFFATLKALLNLCHFNLKFVSINTTFPLGPLKKENYYGGPFTQLVLEAQKDQPLQPLAPILPKDASAFTPGFVATVNCLAATMDTVFQKNEEAPFTEVARP